MAWDAEEKEIGRFRDAADGLERAAKALRSAASDHDAEKGEYKDEAGEEQAESTPRSKQPKNLRDASREARKKYAQGRGEKPRDDNED